MVFPVVVVPFQTFGHEIALSKPRLSQTPCGRCISQPSLELMQKAGLKDWMWKSGSFRSKIKNSNLPWLISLVFGDEAAAAHPRLWRIPLRIFCLEIWFY